MNSAARGRREATRRPIVVVAGLAVLVPVASCAMQGPAFCESDQDCVGGRCDMLSGTCVPFADGRADLGACDPVACTTSCQRSGFADGSCASGTCNCTNPPDAGGEDVPEEAGPDEIGPDEAGPDEASTCDPATCQTICEDLEAASGRCEAGSCICSGGPDADVPLDDGALDEAPRDDGALDEAPRDDGALDEATTPDESIVPEDATAPEEAAPEDVSLPEDTGPPTGPCGGPFSGSGDSGDSGWYCLDNYTIRAIAGNTYTISTCGTCSGDTYLVLSGACYCEDDDGCGDYCSTCTCTASYDGDINICASTFMDAYASWSYTVTGVCRL